MTCIRCWSTRDYDVSQSLRMYTVRPERQILLTLRAFPAWHKKNADGVQTEIMYILGNRLPWKMSIICAT